MRISDWSSDVCSSDLPGGRRARARSPGWRRSGCRASGVFAALLRELRIECTLGFVGVLAAGQRRAVAFVPAGADMRDRQSDGYGNGVVGRVNLGGRRIINRKTEPRKIEEV